MKLKQRIPRCEETKGEVCGECNHAMSNHTMTIDTKDKSYSKLRCNLCKCKNGGF